MTNPDAPATLCTICFDEASDTCGRTVVKLKCSHLFHLDCIGSAFNVTGIMQCPNCREIEIGVWRRFLNDEEYESDDDDETIDVDLQDMISQQRLGNNWCPGLRWFPEFQLPGTDADQDFPVFAADHHRLRGPPLITQISTSQVVFCGQEPVHPAVVNPMYGNIVGSNHTLDPSATPRAPQCDAGGLPDFVSVGDRAILQPGMSSNGFQGQLPAEHMPPPPIQEVVPAMNPTIQNNLQAAIHGEPFLNLPVQNNPAAHGVHHRDEEGVEPYRLILDKMSPFRDPCN